MADKHDSLTSILFALVANGLIAIAKGVVSANANYPLGHMEA